MHQNLKHIYTSQESWWLKDRKPAQITVSKMGNSLHQVIGKVQGNILLLAWLKPGNSSAVIRNPPSLSLSQLCSLLCWHHCGKNGPVGSNFKRSLVPIISEEKRCFIPSIITRLRKNPSYWPCLDLMPTSGPVTVLILINPNHMTESSTRWERNNF